MSTELRVTWIGPGLRMIGDMPDGQAVVMDHVLEGEDREESALRPMQLLLTGMAGCTAMDVVSILQKKRQSFTGLRVEVSAERASEHPKVYTRVHLEYIVTGEAVDPKAVARAIELSVGKYCSGTAIVEKTAELTTSYRLEAQ
jgi:putative redox protein